MKTKDGQIPTNDIVKAICHMYESGSDEYRMASTLVSTAIDWAWKNPNTASQLQDMPGGKRELGEISDEHAIEVAKIARMDVAKKEGLTDREVVQKNEFGCIEVACWEKISTERDEWDIFDFYIDFSDNTLHYYDQHGSSTNPVQVIDYLRQFYHIPNLYTPHSDIYRSVLIALISKIDYIDEARELRESDELDAARELIEGATTYAPSNQQLLSEVERLKGENERLRKELSTNDTLCSFCHCSRGYHASYCPHLTAKQVTE